MEPTHETAIRKDAEACVRTQRDVLDARWRKKADYNAAVQYVLKIYASAHV